MFSDLSAFIEAIGLLGITAIVFAESGLFFGFFFPGDSLLFTAGFLASQGSYGIVPLIFLVTIAAVAGDSAGYWFGAKVGPRIFTRPDSFWFSHKRVEDAHSFFERNGAKSIVLARFIPAVRTFTPIIAGVAGMRYGTFIAYNVIGGILWGSGVPLAGYFLGATVPGIDHYLLPIVLLIVVISFLPLIKEFSRK
ncbi:MAG: DedA family protein [bacterium]|nr:DedA family protein [bacterium]